MKTGIVETQKNCRQKGKNHITEIGKMRMFWGETIILMQYKCSEHGEKSKRYYLKTCKLRQRKIIRNYLFLVFDF